MVHFVEEDSQGPVVNWLAMALIEQNLGRNVLGCAAECVRAVGHHFGESEIGQFQVAVGSYQ